MSGYSFGGVDYVLESKVATTRFSHQNTGIPIPLYTVATLFFDHETQSWCAVHSHGCNATQTVLQR